VVRQYGQFKVTGKTPTNFLRHYYDIHQLLEVEAVQKFSKIAGWKWDVWIFTPARNTKWWTAQKKRILHTMWFYHRNSHVSWSNIKSILKQRASRLDGGPCEAGTREMLKRAHITAGEFRYVGKETDRKWEEGDDISVLEFQATEFGRTKGVVATEEVIAAIQKIGINRCARESGFDRKNFVRKLVRRIPVKRSSHDEFMRWLNGTSFAIFREMPLRSWGDVPQAWLFDAATIYPSGHGKLNPVIDWVIIVLLWAKKQDFKMCSPHVRPSLNFLG